MDLTDFIDEPDDKPAHVDREAVKAKIKQRRAQMLVHSCIYYELNDNIISDHKWQEWADELQVLQTTFPELCAIDFYDWNFRDWDGATGAHLPHRDPWVHNKACYLLERAKINEKENV